MQLPQSQPIPLVRIFLSALIPALIGLVFSSLSTPPIILHDTAAGVFSWLHFINGGSWNTIPALDPNDISQVTEAPLTWWPPGQYLPLGLLHSAGLTFGTAALTLAFISSISQAIGLSFLSHTLGASNKSLPWIAASGASAFPALTAFGQFNGGHVALNAIWPWIALAAFNLRKRRASLLLVLPLLFLIGSFTKYSFSIYALSILIFIWLENLSESPITLNSTGIVHFLKETFSIVLVGIIYIIYYYFVLSSGPTPGTLGVGNSNFLASWGFNSFAPLLGISGLSKIIPIVIRKLLPLGENVSFWADAVTILTLLSPIPIIFYIFLALRSRALERLAGITAIVSFGIIFSLIWKSANISTEARHYEPASILLIAALVAKLGDKSQFHIGWKILSISIMLLGSSALFNQYTSSRITVHENLSVNSLPPKAMLSEIYEATQRSHETLVFIYDPTVAIELNYIFDFKAKILIHPYDGDFKSYKRGRNPNLIFISVGTVFFDTFGGKRLIDYTEEEWDYYSLDGWHIWRPKDRSLAEPY